MEAIQKLIKQKEDKNFQFSPNRKFYETIHIGQKRWGQLYRGEVSPTIDELKALSEFFEVPVTELI